MKLNVIFSIFGVLFNTLFPIIVFPYISRVLGVYAIGEYNYFNSLITYLSLFSSFGIGIYGVREIGKYKDNFIKSNQTTIELVFLNTLFALICLIFLAVLIIFTDYKNNAGIIIVLSIVLFTNAIGAEWYFTAKEKQKYLLIRNIIFKLVSLGLIFLLVKKKDDLLIYAAITTFGLSGVSLLNVYLLKNELNFSILQRLELKKYIFPLMWIFLIEIETRYFGLADVIILGNLAGNDSVGLYSMGLKVFLLISSFLKITAIVLMPRAAFYIENGKQDEFNRFIRSTLNLIFISGMPASIIVYQWADPIVSLLGGKEFLPMIPLLRGFSFLIILVVVINTFVYQMLYPLNRIKSIMTIFSLGIVMNIVLNYLLVSDHSYMGTFYSFSISQIIIFIGLILFERKNISIKLFQYNVLKSLYASIVMVIVAIVVKHLLIDISFVFQILICTISYLLSLYIFKDDFTHSFIFELKDWYGKKKY